MEINYNLLNLFTEVKHKGSVVARYTYLSDGTKLSVRDGNGSGVNGYDYLGSLTYKKSSSGLQTEAALFEDGVILADGSGSDREKINFFFRDHLGSVRVITDGNGAVKERNDYYPFGARHMRSDYAVSANRYKYNGKEKQTTGGLDYLDYGARMYDASLGRWFVIDPAGESYTNISPYAYCANNPVNYIDPDGMKIDSASQKEWELQKKLVTSRRNSLQKRKDRLSAKAKAKGWSKSKLAGKLGNTDERIASLDNSIANFTRLEESSQVYSLDPTAGEMGGVTYDPNTGNVVINYRSTAGFVHESTHAGQYETGDMAFNSQTGDSYAQDVEDEVAAYKAQFAYDPSSVSGLSSSSVANSFGRITSHWVLGIKNSERKLVYGPNLKTRTGLYPLNINSTIMDLMRAYPNIDFKGLPSNFRIKTIEHLKYK